MTFRRDVEGLRAIAILLVVGYHAGLPGLTGGYIGVDIFFVLSGFLITGLLWHELSSTGRLNLAEFYARRARRLLPAAGIVLLATLLAGYWLLPPVEQLRYTGTAIATALYVSNLWFAKEATDYLAPDSHLNPFLHTWSLSVEEQFYLVWPCFLLLVALSARAAAARRQRLCAAMGGVVLVTAAAAIWFTRVHQPTAFFGSPFRAWEFAAGGLAAMIQPGGRIRWIAPWAGAMAVALAAVTFNERTPYPGIAAFAPVVGTVLLLWSTPDSRPARWLSTGVLQIFGRYSYSWYLWHWPVLIFGVAALGPDSLLVRLGLVALSLGLSAITYALIENPVRRAPTLVPYPRRSLAAAASLTAVSFSLAFGARVIARQAAQEETQRAIVQAVDEVPAVYPRGCHLAREATEPVPCEFGDRTSSRSVVLFGDSHAAQWLPALERIASLKKARIVTMTKSACPAADIEPYDRTLNRGYRECVEWRAAALRWILNASPAAVVISNATIYIANGDAESGGVTVEQWGRALASTLRPLQEAGIPVLLIRDTPNPGFDVPACLARAAWNPFVFRRGCDFPAGGELANAIDAAERAVLQDTPRNASIDLNASICEPALGGCRSRSMDVIVFRDNSHVTTTFASKQAAEIERRLDQMRVF